MYKNKRILGIIPARGGSKGLPGKNIKPINGKPLINWTIDTANKSKLLDYFFVSTDDADIKQVALEYGAKVIDRPKKLAQDGTSTFDVIKHHLDTDDFDDCDLIILLEPTSPLRTINDIDNSIKKLIDNYDKADSLVSVGKIHMENPYITKVIKHGIVTDFIHSDEKITQRQQLDDVYFPYGVVYLSKIDSYLEHKTFYQDRTLPYYIERWQNYEIDDIYDHLVVERLLALWVSYQEDLWKSKNFTEKK